MCDLGIVGKDTILEKGGSFYEVLDLGFGRCRFALAAPAGSGFFDTYKTRRVASKYPEVTRRFFAGKGMDVDIIKIEGSVELAPILGLADAIVDIVETGATLKANGLIPIEDVAPVSRPAHRQHRQHEAVQGPDRGLYHPLPGGTGE